MARPARSPERSPSLLPRARLTVARRQQRRASWAHPSSFRDPPRPAVQARLSTHGPSETAVRAAEQTSPTPTHARVPITGEWTSASGATRAEGPVRCRSWEPLAIQFVDPQPDWLPNEVPPVPEYLLGTGTECKGAAADGITPVLVKAVTPVPASVTFSISSPNADAALGTLRTLKGVPSLSPVTVETIPSGDGLNVAFAVFQVPDVFPKTPASSLPVSFSATASSTTGYSDNAANASLLLTRPPLILLHGLFSSGSTWDLQLYRAGYSPSLGGVHCSTLGAFIPQPPFPA